MTGGFPPGLYLDGLYRAGLEEQLADGVRAFVRLYYRNYTDATEVEHPVLKVLRMLLETVETSLDLEELVTQEEERINADGGVRSDTDGTVHKVQTYADEP